MQIVIRLLVGVLAVTAFSAVTADEEPLSSELAAFVVLETEDGSEKMEPAESVVPGDLIEYRINYQNNGEEAISGLVVTGPVPAGVEYVAESAATDESHNLEVSTDNGETWAIEPVVRTVTDESGEAREEIVPPSEYTHVRWVAVDPMDPEESQEYRYRVRVTSE